DPRQKPASVAPPREEVPPYLNFAPLDNAVDALTQASAEYRKDLDAASANGGALASASLAEVNQMLIDNEQQLTLEKGLPGRPWYKHYIDAPGQYTGYAAKTLPAVREAIELKRWKEADEEIVVTSKV